MFNRLTLDVPTCATETKTTAFTKGLREGEFFRSLTKKVPGDFEDLLSQAEKYNNIEEAQKQKREAVRRERGDRVAKPDEKGQRRGNQGHFSHHVPLKIIQDREVREYSRDLPPYHQLTRTEKRGFCILHKPGPSAREDSRNAPRSDLSRRRDPEPDRRKTSPPVSWVIKMISGGSIDGDSNRARKSKSRRECMEVEGVRKYEAIIIFGPEDLKGVNLPHNDVLVIQAQVANYDILRVFVDSDSSVNVIFKEAFAQMNLQGFQLETVETALFWFCWPCYLS
ncbi:uncharacterized protein LOC142554665 [Primulina tabacum]|uniref:uncharacterized protein LOC142554665 n=1 Tax=Primulina tabacum TaxID=48773 RepID=UPI003F59927A